MPRPSVGRIVHYTTYATSDNRFASGCVAAIVTEAFQNPSTASLYVILPTGTFIELECQYADNYTTTPGTWHWPERVDD